jgi:hypothetical protein
VIAGILCLVAANVAVAEASRRLLSRVATGRPHADALIFLLIRLTLISAIVLVAGLTWLIGPFGLLALSAAALALSVFSSPPIAFRIPRWTVGWLLGAAALMVVVRLLLQIWFFAPYSADALSYHLPKIAEWVRAGHFTRQLGVDTHAAFPAGFELIETWWVAFLHHDVVIELAGVEFLVLAGAAAFALARYLQLSERWAAFAALAFALTPGLYLQATSELNDLPVTALVLSAASLIVLEAPAALALVPIGLGIGVKGTFLFTLPGLALLWFMARFPRVRREIARPAAALAIAALAAGGFWYARNALWFGNPLHPMTTSGVRETGGYVTIRFGVDAAGAVDNLSEMVESRIGDRQAAYSALSRRVSGWGALPFAVGLPAMLLLLRRDPKYRRLTLALAISAASVLLLVQHDDWFARFVLFFAVVPVLGAAAAAAADRLVLLVAVPALLLQAFSTMVPEELPRAYVAGLAAQPWRTRTLARQFDAQMDGLGDAVGYYADNVGEAYWCYGADYSRRVAYLRATTPAALVEEMKAAGVTALYDVAGTAERQRVLNDAVRMGLLIRARRQIYTLKPIP